VPEGRAKEDDVMFAEAPKGLPQLWQTFAPAGLGSWQSGQSIIVMLAEALKGLPQLWQTFAPAGLECWQIGQGIISHHLIPSYLEKSLLSLQHS